MNITFQTLLLLKADPSWVKIAIFIVCAIIWVVKHLIDNAKAVPAKNVLKPRPLPPSDVLKPEPVASQQKLAGEIEQFLARANQKRREKGQRKQQARPAVKKPPAPTPKSARRLVEVSRPDRGFEVSSSESIPVLEQALSTQQFSERAAHMVDDIARGDAAREAHRKQVFDHKLGNLADTSAAQGALTAADIAAQQATAAAANAAATPIAAMLANPESLKQAFVLNEILSLPEHRW